MPKKILVTGGCGYIGAHTIVSLLEAGFDVISVDDNSRSMPGILNGIQQITGKYVKNYCVDMRNKYLLEDVFHQNPDIYGIIHFAAFKSVAESVLHPLMYYENNILSLLNLLTCVETYSPKYFVFSSSCSVYGDPDSVPVNEFTELGEPKSPYAATKQMCEQILQDFVKQPCNKQKVCILRYFNPAGAHPSLHIGENCNVGVPSLVSNMVLVATKQKQQPLKIFGKNYETRDGTCIRDFIHVSDIADAHVRALEYIETYLAHPVLTLNLGLGRGYSVLEAVAAFQRSTGISLPIVFAEKRPGDVETIYCDNEIARNLLKWKPKYTLEDIMKTAYEYEMKRLNSSLSFSSFVEQQQSNLEQLAQ